MHGIYRVGRIAFGKLSQAMDYGGQTIQIKGDFDDCMKQVQDVCTKLGLYLLNSLNPFRLEGQKTIMFRIIEGLGWEVPDWIVVPGATWAIERVRQGILRIKAAWFD